MTTPISNQTPLYSVLDKDGKQQPIKILFTDNNPMIIKVLRERQNNITAGWLKTCYQIDYYCGDIVPLALGKNPSTGDTTGMLTNVAFVSPANSMGHMSGGIDYPLNYKMFPNVAYNVQTATRKLAQQFYAVQDRTLRDIHGNAVLITGSNNEAGPADITDMKDYNGATIDDLEYQETDNGSWFGPLINEVGQAFLPVGSASISPTQKRDEVSNGRNQFLVSAPTMYTPGSSIAGTGNAEAAIFATLACVQKYNRFLTRPDIGVHGITTIVLPGMGTGVGGMTPYEFANEAFQALELYAKYYLGYSNITTDEQPIMPAHMVDLVPYRNRYILRNPSYFLCKQRPGYSIAEFDMCYELMPRPNPEIERLKRIKPSGGVFGNASIGKGMFDSRFGMSGFMSDGNPAGVSESNFIVDTDYQAEIEQYIAEADETQAKEEEEDDLGAEERLLQRMAAMDKRRDAIDKETAAQNHENINNALTMEFLQTRDPKNIDYTMTLEQRYAQHISSREGYEPVYKEVTGLTMEDAQAKFAAMMAARNNEVYDGSEIINNETRQSQFQDIMQNKNTEFTEDNSLTSMWH